MSGTEAGEDAMPAIRRALSDCRKMKADTLVLPEGELRILPDMAYEEYQFISNNTESLKRIAFDLDGMEILQQVTGLPQETPVIIISARDRESEKVKALDMGADDYIVKPFGVSEMLARVRTTLRRSDRLRLSQGSQKDVYHIKDLTVDIAKHQVLLDGEEVHFTQNEFKILELLCIHAGKVLTYDFILEHVWGPYGSSSNQILRVNMANIRRKLKENPSEPKYVLTELGIGYRMLED